MYKPKAKLEIETSEETDEELAWLIENEAPTNEGEKLNKSTVVNRAVQLYAMLLRARHEGNTVFIGTVDATSADLTPVNWR